MQTRTWFDAIVGAGETPDVDPVRVDFNYNAAGRESEITRWNGLTQTQLVARTVRTYDLAGRSDLLSHRNSTDGILAQYNYDYDFSGLLNHEVRTHQDAQFNQTIDYRYDLTGQLTDVDFTGQADEHYVYDANGNRITSQVGTEHSAYSTDTANQLRSDGLFNYEYDGEGNLVKKINSTDNSATTYRYDHRNRLVEVIEKSAGGVILNESRYTYDGFGRRITDTVNGQSRITTYNRENAWADFATDGTAEARYLFGNRVDAILGRVRPNEEAAWYLTDHLGTVRALANSGGNIINHVQYQSFGMVVIESNPALTDRFLFTAREFDKGSGLYYYRSRTYEPHVGRFLQNDPLGFEAADVNLFRYVFNSAPNASDPTGMVTLEYVYLGAIAGGLSGLAFSPVSGQDPVTATFEGAVFGAFFGLVPALLAVSFSIELAIISTVPGFVVGGFLQVPRLREFVRERVTKLGYSDRLSTNQLDFLIDLIIEILI